MVVGTLEERKRAHPNNPEFSNCRKQLPPQTGKLERSNWHQKLGTHGKAPKDTGALMAKPAMLSWCWGPWKNCLMAVLVRWFQKPLKKTNCLWKKSLYGNWKPCYANERSFYVTIKANPLRISTRQNFIAWFQWLHVLKGNQNPFLQKYSD